MTSQPALLGGEPAFPEGLPLARPPVEASDDLLQQLREILDSGVLTNGPTVRLLEERVAELLGVPHAVAVSSCTAGLMLALRACGMRGRVVLPSYTFAATAHALAWNGGVPIFADIEASTLTLDPVDAHDALSTASGMMATHLAGTPCDVSALDSLAQRSGVPMVYDAAHALGSRVGGQPVGGFGTAEVFSLSPTKPVVAVEGGLVCTRESSLAEDVRIGRDYGNPGDYDCLFPGLNARMSELHAAVALSTLATLEERLDRRRLVVTRLLEGLRDLPGVSWPEPRPGDDSTHKDLTILVDVEQFGMSAKRLADALRAEGVETRRYYDPPVHRQRAYRSSPVSRQLPVTEHVSARVLTLPLWDDLPAALVDRLVDCVAVIQRRAEVLEEVPA